MSIISGLTGLFSDSPDASLAIVMSALSGVAMALAVTLALAVYIRSGRRSSRDVLRHALAGLAAVGLFAFVAYDTHHAALAAVSDSQIELHTDRNQTLAQIEGARDLADGRAVLRGAVALDHRTAERMLVVNLPGRGTFEFKLRLTADPARTTQFGPWHLADRVASPVAGQAVPQDAFAIRYRVL